MIDIDKYEGHAKEGWYFDSAHVLRDGYDKEIAELVGEDWLDDEATQKLIADAPFLLEEHVRLTNILRYVGARLYLDKNNYRHYDYAKLLDLIIRQSGEPDDMSGPMGAMITELRYYDEKLEEDKEMIE
tara:strand:+ start:1857 stop:2243 length:387 start_codon:yes stop_codon:yes gene_type:complete